MTNSIILQSIDSDGLKNIIGQVFDEKMQLLKTADSKENFLTRHEVAKKLRISLPTLNEFTKNGRITGYRIGGRVLYKESEIEASLCQIVASKYKRR